MKTTSFAAEREDNFNFKETLVLFWKRKWVTINTLVVILAAVSIFAFQMPDEYESSAQVLIEQIPTPVIQSQTQDVALKDTAQQYYQTHKLLFTSFPVLKIVVEQLELQKKLKGPMYLKVPAIGEPLTVEEVVAKLKKLVTVDFLNNIYTITVKYPDPFMAAAIANTIAKTYVKQNLEGRLYLSKELLELFPDQAQKLTKYTTQGQLDDLSRDDLIAKLPTVQADPTVKALEQKQYFLENEISRLSNRYKPKHPTMADLEANLKFVKERLKAQRESIAADLKEKIANKFQEINIKILQEASIPKNPTGPNRFQIILVAGLIALGMGIGLVVLLDTLDDKVNNPDDVERFIQLPFLGSIYKIKKIKEEDKRNLFVLHEPMSETAEAFKHLRVNINFSTAPEHRRTLLVTSTLPQEGKSFVAANLAVSKAQDGKKILLVDADLRRPKLHKYFGLENKIGLSNILTTNASLDSVIQKTSLPSLEVVTSGPVSPNPPEIFGSQAMKNFLKNIDGKYETVIFDAPPSFGLSDTLVLGNMIDATVYVIQAHKVSYKLIEKTKSHLIEKGVRIVGTALNNLEAAKDKSYYYDYQSYGYTYSTRRDGASSPK